MLSRFVAYCTENPFFSLMFCLGLGFCLGKLRTGKFPMNATIGTILIALAMNLLIRKFQSQTGGAENGILLPGMLENVFFAMFSFALGYSAGPELVKAIREMGWRQCLKPIVFSLLFSGTVILVSISTIRAIGIADPSKALGILAGAQTQSSILGIGNGGDSVAYALCYTLGTVCMILFVQRIGPAILRTDTKKAVAEHMARINTKQAPDIIPARAIQLRAYDVLSTCSFAGKTVEDLEQCGDNRFEIVSIHRGGAELDVHQKTKLCSGDVLVAVGDKKTIHETITDGFCENTDDKYTVTNLFQGELVVTKTDANIFDALSDYGILVQGVRRNGILLPVHAAGDIAYGDFLIVSGITQAVKRASTRFGYLKDTGTNSDLPFMFLSISMAIVLGAFTFRNIKLGTSCVAMLLGMGCGVFNQKSPKYAYVPPAAVVLLKNLGLNLFIASKTLTAKLVLSEIFGVQSIRIILAGAVILFLPLVIGVFMGKLLKMDSVEILGALCGSGTCTAALNALEEETGSSVFTASYTSAYVVGNILLTLAGIVVEAFI